jgi:hypothetical protein
MEIITVGEKQFPVCPHCSGTSLCQFSTIMWREELADADICYWYLRCPQCGSGTEKENKRALVALVCAVCEGKGYLLVS